MTPSRALEEAVEAVATFLIPAFRSGGAIAYVKAGKEIPELLLPGRLLQRMPTAVREALRDLTSRAACDIPDWVVRQYV